MILGLVGSVPQSIHARALQTLRVVEYVPREQVEMQDKK